MPAQELRPGDALESAFRYPEGYVPPDLSDAPQLGPVRVTRVEPAGAGEVMRGTVRDTHVLVRHGRHPLRPVTRSGG